MKKIILPLILIGFTFYLHAQGERSFELNHVSDQFKSAGLSLRYQQTIREHEKLKRNGKVIDKLISVGIRYSWYRRNDHHIAHILSPYVRFERKSPRNIIFQSEIGLGYFLRKQLNDTYTIVDGRLVNKQVTFHRFYPHLGLGLGYDFEQWTGLPIQLLFRPQIGYETPNNAGGLIHLVSEFGVRYRIK